MIRRASVLILASLLAWQATAAQEKGHIKLHMRPGDQYALEDKDEIRQQIKLTADGQPAAQVDQTIRAAHKGTVVVLAVRDGVPTSSRVTFDKACTNTIEIPGQQPTKMPLALAGKTVTVSRGADGKLQHDYPEQIDEATMRELAGWLDLGGAYLPQQAVGVGDHWEVDQRALAARGLAAADERARIHCKLVRIERKQDGRKTAHIAVTASVTEHPTPTIAATSDLTGTSLVDLGRGHTLVSALKGKLTLRGTQAAPGADGATRTVHVEGSGTVVTTTTVAFIGNDPKAAGPRLRHPQRLPTGYQAIRDEKGSGRVLVARYKAARSAKALLGSALKGLTGYFDHRPYVTGAMQDKADRLTEATFRSTLGGVAVRGLMLTRTHERDGAVGLCYDRADALPRSLPRLARLLGERMPPVGAARPRPQLQWQTVMLPRQSGTIRLPTGYRITHFNRHPVYGVCMDITGPEGQGVSLGASTPVTEAPQVSPYPLAAPYSDPETAVLTLQPILSQRAGHTVRGLRVIEKAPVPSPTGRAAYLHLAGEVDGRPYRSLALAITSRTPFGQWLLYQSSVAAPEGVFQRSLPVMLQIWRSWKISDRVFQEGMKRAMATMKECNKIIQDVIRYRDKASAKAHAAWVEYIRETRAVTDTLTGEVKDMPLHKVDSIVAKANEAQGYARFKQIPPEELNPK